MLNCQFRREALSYGSVFLRTATKDDKNLKKKDLKNMVTKDNEKFSDIY